MTDSQVLISHATRPFSWENNETRLLNTQDSISIQTKRQNYWRIYVPALVEKDLCNSASQEPNIHHFSQRTNEYADISQSLLSVWCHKLTIWHQTGSQQIDSLTVCLMSQTHNLQSDIRQTDRQTLRRSSKSLSSTTLSEVKRLRSDPICRWRSKRVRVI
jgi:hypothetical protein